jgi:hypothetical protein
MESLFKQTHVLHAATPSLMVYAPPALMPEGSGNMAKNKRLRGNVEQLLRQRGPMTSQGIIDALIEEKKSVPGMNTLAMVLRRHKEFTEVNEVKCKGHESSYSIKIWYLKEAVE